MKPLRDKLIKYYIDKGKLNEVVSAYVDHGKEAIVTIVNVRTAKPEYVSSRQVAEHAISEETFIDAILASCSEPVFTEPVRVFARENGHPYQDDLFYDGGVKEFIPLEHAADLGAEEIWAVSTHLPNPKETDWGGLTEPSKVNLLKVLGWTVGSMLDEVDRGDRFRAEVYQRLHTARKELKEKAQGMNLSDANVASLVESLTAIAPARIDLKALFVVHPLQEMHTSLEFQPDVMANYFTWGALAIEKFVGQLKQDHNGVIPDEGFYTNWPV
jgi:predicted acylesterase/phospholipase RssA